MSTNFSEQLLYDKSFDIFRNFYTQDMETQISNCDQLRQYVTTCDKYIAEFLHQSKPELVTLYRMLIKFYYKKPFATAGSELTLETIGQLANSATMNLAETGTLDENLDTTKNLISQ